VVVVGVVGVVVAAVVVVYIYPLFSGPAAPYLLCHYIAPLVARSAPSGYGQ
jgi:hypothetical protein